MICFNTQAVKLSKGDHSCHFDIISLHLWCQSDTRCYLAISGYQKSCETAPVLATPKNVKIGTVTITEFRQSLLFN
jgi:hypothetical protein